MFLILTHPNTTHVLSIYYTPVFYNRLHTNNYICIVVYIYIIILLYIVYTYCYIFTYNISIYIHYIHIYRTRIHNVKQNEYEK